MYVPGTNWNISMQKKVVQRYELKSKEVNYLQNLTQDIGLKRKGTTKL